MPPRPRPPVDSSDMHDDDSDSRDGSALPEDGLGKASSSQVRKAQNRVAQREFRLRKQQYVRDLEARVEILSSDKEDRVELMTLLIRNLLKENKELRDMVKTMASFVGEGLGSCLPRLGLSAPQLDAILNRADTDTGYDAFLALKASREMEAANPGLPLGEVRRRASSAKRKRTSTEDATGEGGKLPDGSSATPDFPPVGLDMFDGGDSSKKPKPTETANKQPESADSFPSYAYLFPDLDAFASSTPAMAPQNTPNYPYNPFSTSPAFVNNAQFSIPPSLMNPNSLPQYMQTNTGFGLTVPPAQNFAGSYMTQMTNMPGTSQFPPNMYGMAPSKPSTDETEADRQRRLREAVANITTGEGAGTKAGGNMSPAELQDRIRMQEEIKKTLENCAGDHSDGKTEAIQLITYHLNNFRVNHSYNLPTSLRPTKVQRTIPHEHAIDGIIFPTIRDRMILLRGRYDLVDAFHGMLNEYRVHGQDVLDHHSWEISEKWLKDFSILVDDEVYEITNRWRIQRGECPLVRPEGASVVGPWDAPTG